MDTIEIREKVILVNGKQLKSVKYFDVRANAEDNYAEVTIKLLAKLT